MLSPDSHTSRDTFSQAMTDKYLDKGEAKQLLALFRESGVRYTVQALQDLKTQLGDTLTIGENSRWVSSQELMRAIEAVSVETRLGHPASIPVASSKSGPTLLPVKESSSLKWSDSTNIASLQDNVRGGVTTFDQLMHNNTVALIGDSITVGLSGLGNQEVYTSSISAKVGASSAMILKNMQSHINRYPDVTTIFVLAGTNDVISGSSKQAIDNLLRMKHLCDSKDIRMIASTLPPMGGYIARRGNVGAINQSIIEVNAFIRGNFPGFIDYHSLLQDPNRPTYLSREARSSDGLHIGNQEIMRSALLQSFHENT